MDNQSGLMNFIENKLRDIEKWVKTPSYDDPGLQRKAELLHTLTFMVLGTGFATLAITPFVFVDPQQGVPATLIVMLFIFGIQVLNRKGYPNAAAHLFVTSIVIFDFGMILFSGGFQSQFLSSFITISIMGGLILGDMYAFHLAGISIASYLALFFLDFRGLTPAPLIEFTAIALILINVVNLFLAATVLVMALMKYEENFKSLVEKDQALENTNIELKQEAQAREQAQTQLQQSEIRLKSALMHSPFPIMLHAQDGEILLVNTAWIRSTGYQTQDLPVFEDWLEHLFRENRSQVIKIIDLLLTGEDSGNEGFFDLFKQNGETLKWYLRWTKLPALPDGRNLFLAMATDLTDLASVESALRDREETLSIFTLITNDGIWDWDLSTDRVVFDSRYYTMAGYEVDEFPYELEEFRKRIHADDVEKVFSEAQKHLSGEIDRFIVEFRFLRQDGSWQWILGRGKITEQDEYGNPLRFVGTHTDISAQKSIEEKLSEYQLQLEDIVDDRTLKLNERINEVERLNAALTNILDDYQAANERLSLLGENLSAANQELESLTYSLSTNLRDPIHAIQQTAIKLSGISSQDLKKKEIELIGEITAHAELVKRQIDDLLKISQLSQQDLRIETVDFRKLVAKVLKDHDSEIKNRSINTDVKDLPACQGDQALLQMVVENLISNSIRYTVGVEKPKIQVGYQPDQGSDRLIYFVKDNGIGFDPKDQELIFGTFQQLDNVENHPGTGIGLTLAKLIINKHGGKIWAESQIGEGATFYFDLASREGDQG